MVLARRKDRFALRKIEARSLGTIMLQIRLDSPIAARQPSRIAADSRG